MLKRRSYVVVIVVGALSAVGPVFAADSGPFVGFDLGWVRYPRYYAVLASETASPLSTVLTNSSLDRDRFGWSVAAGYQFNRYLRAEAGFVDLGRISGSLTDTSGVATPQGQLQFSAKGETLAAVGMLPLGQWDLFLKGGVLFADTELQYPGKDSSYHTQHALLGCGVDRNFTDHWSARLAVTNYFTVGNTAQIRGPNIRMLSAGLTYAF
jgi:long-subunit fatty acid transport protein